MTHTFKTRLHRGQLTIFDFAGDNAKYGGPHAGKVYFSIAVLPATAHRATAFSAGTTLYHGECLRTALATLGNHIGLSAKDLASQLPPKMRKYDDKECI